MSSLAAIHVAKKQLGLDEDTYRAVLTRVTGKSSAAAMDEAERGRVVEELRRQGFQPAPRQARGEALNGPRKALQGPFAKKLQALWIAAWNLGLVDDRQDSALVAFVKRQTGIEHMNWLRDPADAEKVIEALKGWMAREASVDWSVRKDMPPWCRVPGYRIASAQFWILFRTDPSLAAAGLISLPKFIDAHLDHLGDPSKSDSSQWRAIMNLMGDRIRKAKAR